MTAAAADRGSALVAAVRHGRPGEVRDLLAAGADPNHRSPDTGLTVLMTAAGSGTVESVRVLLAAGADARAVDARAGGTALHKAVQRGDLAAVEALVDAGAFVDAVTTSTGHTPLLDAFWYKRPDIVAHLLERGAGINLHTHYGFSMQEHIQYALGVNTRGRDELLAAQRRLEQRIAGDESTAADQTLMAAVVAGDASTAKDLLAQGAEVDARAPIVNGFNDWHTPLLVAARDGHAEIVDLLLEAGADVNAVEPTFGAVPLHKAVYNGHADITRTLAAHPEVDLDFQGATNGYTPLHDALWHGFEDCARVLLEFTPRLDLVGHDNRTPHDLAIDVFGRDHPLAGLLQKTGNGGA